MKGTWVRASSIMLFAAGWATSISRRMAWPSFVSTMPPMGSSNIFSIALGPRHDRMMSATVFAAAIFDSCALRPVFYFFPRFFDETHLLAVRPSFVVAYEEMVIPV